MLERLSKCDPKDYKIIVAQVEFNQILFDENKQYSAKEVYDSIDKASRELVNKFFPEYKYVGFKIAGIALSSKTLNGKEANQLYNAELKRLMESSSLPDNANQIIPNPLEKKVEPE